MPDQWARSWPWILALLHEAHTLSVVLGGAGWNPPETLDEFRQQAEAFEKGMVPVREGDDAMALAAMLRALSVSSEEVMPAVSRLRL